MDTVVVPMARIATIQGHLNERTKEATNTEIPTRPRDHGKGGGGVKANKRKEFVVQVNRHCGTGESWEDWMWPPNIREARKRMADYKKSHMNPKSDAFNKNYRFRIIERTITERVVE